MISYLQPVRVHINQHTTKRAGAPRYSVSEYNGQGKWPVVDDDVPAICLRDAAFVINRSGVCEMLAVQEKVIAVHEETGSKVTRPPRTLHAWVQGSPVRPSCQRDASWKRVRYMLGCGFAIPSGRFIEVKIDGKPYKVELPRSIDRADMILLDGTGVWAKNPRTTRPRSEESEDETEGFYQGNPVRMTGRLEATWSIQEEPWGEESPTETHEEPTMARPNMKMNPATEPCRVNWMPTPNAKGDPEIPRELYIFIDPKKAGKTMSDLEDMSQEEWERLFDVWMNLSYLAKDTNDGRNIGTAMLAHVQVTPEKIAKYGWAIRDYEGFGQNPVGKGSRKGVEANENTQKIVKDGMNLLVKMQLQTAIDQFVQEDLVAAVVSCWEDTKGRFPKKVDTKETDALGAELARTDEKELQSKMYKFQEKLKENVEAATKDDPSLYPYVLLQFLRCLWSEQHLGMPEPCHVMTYIAPPDLS